MTLEEIRAICNAASPGPWEYSSERHVTDGFGDAVLCLINGGRISEQVAANGALIAMARTVLPKLLKVAEAAKEWAVECREDIGHDKMNLTFLCQALAELEAES